MINKKNPHVDIKRAARASLLLVLMLWITGTINAACTGADLSSQDLESRTRQLVHQRYIDGISPQKARALGEAAVKILAAMLDDPSEERFHLNIVSILGFIGSEQGLPPLLGYLDSAEGELSIHRFRAMLWAPEAIGLICSHLGEHSKAQANALTELEGLVARPKGRDWWYGRHRGQALQTLMAKVAINGLGRSGSPRALDFVSSLDEREQDQRLQPNITEALWRLEGVAIPNPSESALQQRASGSSGRANTVQSLSVSRHTSISYSNSSADSTFSSASSLLQTDNNGCTDEVACAVQVQRSGSVSIFGRAGDGLDVITSESELTAVFAKSGDFKVVTSAQSCCGVTGAIYGCGKMNSLNTVIIASADPDIWLHELGHNKGLSHSDSCSRYIMHSTALSTNAVTSSECAAFKSR